LTMRVAIGSVLCLVCWLGFATAAPAQETRRGQPEGVGELREAMHRYFETRVRAELGLTDEQFDSLMPLVRGLEESRIEFRRQRMETVRNLQRGIREGGTDTKLQEMLDRLDSIEDEGRRTERSAMVGIDELLTVRQRVQFRFFSQRFRSELERRIRRMRDDRAPDGGRGPDSPRRDGR